MSSMKCIICKSAEKDGKIVHKRTCPDYLRPNHMTEVKKDTTERCGVEHPYWKNPCVLRNDHFRPHEDDEGHEWFGIPED